MIQYIDKSTLVVEIERRIKKYTLLQQKPEMSDLQEELQYKMDCLESIKGYIINTLEVMKEVDFKKEVNAYMVNEMKFLSDEVGYDTLSTIARYFFELGLKCDNRRKD